MNLTEDSKKHIDSLRYGELLDRHSYILSGSDWYKGETGDYLKKRMRDLEELGDYIGVKEEVGEKKCRERLK